VGPQRTTKERQQQRTKRSGYSSNGWVLRTKTTQTKPYGSEKPKKEIVKARGHGFA